MSKKGTRCKKTIGIYTKEDREKRKLIIDFYHGYKGDKCRSFTYYSRIDRGWDRDRAILPYISPNK